jgi:hypothetical protein
LISIEYSRIKKVEAIQQAISPDNLHIKEGIEIVTQIDDKVLNIEIKCYRGVGSLLATLDDLIQCIQAAEAVLGEVQK